MGKNKYYKFMWTKFDFKLLEKNFEVILRPHIQSLKFDAILIRKIEKILKF